MFGANAGQIWQMTFDSADLGSTFGSFTPVPGDSGYLREGNGMRPAKRLPLEVRRDQRPHCGRIPGWLATIRNAGCDGA